MKFFNVSVYEGDTCGNCDAWLLLVVSARSIEEVEAKFPRGFLCGYTVEEVPVKDITEVAGDASLTNWKANMRKVGRS